MTTDNTHQLLSERSLFEAWMQENRPSIGFARNSDGGYYDLEADDIWTGWQARAALNRF